MDIATFISEQESKLTGETSDVRKPFVAEKIAQAQAANPTLQGSPAQLRLGYVPPPHPDPGKRQRMLDCLHEGYGKMPAVFDELPSASTTDRFHRKAIKQFVASPQVKNLEEKINEQCFNVLRAKNDQECAEALAKVEQGMKYLVDLVVRRMNGGKK
jgi:hypothetical protein